VSLAFVSLVSLCVLRFLNFYYNLFISSHCCATKSTNNGTTVPAIGQESFWSYGLSTYYENRDIQTHRHGRANKVFFALILERDILLYQNLTSKCPVRMTVMTGSCGLSHKSAPQVYTNIAYVERLCVSWVAQSVVSGYGLDDRAIGVQSLAKAAGFFF
jgi:hypothetical protein